MNENANPKRSSHGRITRIKFQGEDWQDVDMEPIPLSDDRWDDVQIVFNGDDNFIDIPPLKGTNFIRDERIPKPRLFGDRPR